MFERMTISDVEGLEILDSRGNPTVQAKVILAGGAIGKAKVPSGASTGQFEALEMRDGGERYNGKGVLEAVSHIENEIKKELLAMDGSCQRSIDERLLALDGTDDKSNLGANAMLGVSLAAARAAANEQQEELYRYLGGIAARKLPVPMMNILNGGKHAANTVDFQEFMIIPRSAKTFSDGLVMCAEVYHKLAEILHQDGLMTAVGDEGGFAPDLKDAREVLDYIKRAVEEAGYRFGEDIAIALDVAASELYCEDCKKYEFPGEGTIRNEHVVRSTEEMIAYLEKLCEEYPILSIEDGLDEEDWEGWMELTRRLGQKIQLVGDDLFVTNTKRLERGIREKAGNAILIKVNQIGTLTEAMDAIEMAKDAGYGVIISHRSGETSDTFIADLAVAVNVGQIKTGAPCRAERTEKYNRLLEIERDLKR